MVYRLAYVPSKLPAEWKTIGTEDQTGTAFEEFARCRTASTSTMTTLSTLTVASDLAWKARGAHPDERPAHREEVTLKPLSENRRRFNLYFRVPS
jgi:hypothetical protein